DGRFRRSAGAGPELRTEQSHRRDVAGARADGNCRDRANGRSRHDATATGVMAFIHREFSPISVRSTSTLPYNGTRWQYSFLNEPRIMTLRLPTLDRFKQVRACNGCTACCTEVAVKELGKPARCRCEHEKAGGCAIYGDHPMECRKYACAWVMGALGADEKYRPDKCVLLFSLSSTD